MEPSRKSARISALPAPEPDELPDSDDETASSIRAPPKGTIRIRQLPRPASPPAATVDEDYDPSYRAPRPKRNAEEGGKGVFLFEEGYEGFTPNLSPEEMMRGGMFGGTAFM